MKKKSLREASSFFKLQKLEYISLKTRGMSKQLKSTNSKKAEKEYMFSLKILIVNEIEKGNVSVAEAKHKYGIQDKATILEWVLEFGGL